MTNRKSYTLIMTTLLILMIILLTGCGSKYKTARLDREADHNATPEDAVLYMLQARQAFVPEEEAKVIYNANFATKTSFDSYVKDLEWYERDYKKFIDSVPEMKEVTNTVTNVKDCSQEYVQQRVTELFVNYDDTDKIEDIKLVEVSVEYANEKFSEYNQTNELEVINVDGKWYVFQ